MYITITGFFSSFSIKVFNDGEQPWSTAKNGSSGVIFSFPEIQIKATAEVR